MKRRFFLFVSAVIAVMTVSCARDEMRASRYDAHECPFCMAAKGVCSYCEGTKKCAFCDGKGKRTTVIPSMPEIGLKRLTYQEECPFCAGTAVCRHCDGKGNCWACDGGGRIDSWDFQAKAAKKNEGKQ